MVVLCIILFYYRRLTLLLSLDETYLCTLNLIMALNKNGVLGWATLIMIIIGLGLIALGAFKYSEVAGYGFAAVGVGFFAIAWVFNALKGRV